MKGSIVFVGDIIPTESVNRSLEREIINFHDSLAQIFQGDAFFGNFEGTISRTRFDLDPTSSKRFRFQAPPGVLGSLKALFKKPVLSFANNHCFDYGLLGLEETMVNLKDSGVIGVGLGYHISEALSPRVVSLGVLRVAFVALTDLLPEGAYATNIQSGAGRLSKETLPAAVRAARDTADIVIVSLHTIADFSQAFSFWPDRHQTDMGHFAIDCGADIVIGHQPHGLQFVERYRGKLIFHSLGAFIYDPALAAVLPPSHKFWPAIQVYGGGAVKLSLCQSGVYDYRIIPTRIVSKGGRLTLVPGFWYQQLIAKISRAYAHC